MRNDYVSEAANVTALALKQLKQLVSNESDENKLPMHEKEVLKWLLSKTILVVTFIKKSDKKERVMFCTTNASLIAYKESSNIGTYYTGSDQYRVWDIEEEAWRSFNFSSITNVKWFPNLKTWQIKEAI